MAWRSADAEKMAELGEFMGESGAGVMLLAEVNWRVQSGCRECR